MGDRGRGVFFLVEAGVDRECDRGAAPGGLDPDDDDDEVQAHRVDDPLGGGANGVAEYSGSVHFPAGLVKEGVVAEQLDRAGRGVAGHDVDGDYFPEAAHRPGAVADEPVICVVGAPPGRVGDGYHRGDGASARHAYPPG